MHSTPLCLDLLFLRLLYHVGEIDGGFVASFYSTFFQDSNEPKRKATKRSAKSEKELLELTLLYQKAIAERDSGEFINNNYY